jgi:uncharacterized coiled-coil DUF342 family protein
MTKRDEIENKIRIEKRKVDSRINRLREINKEYLEHKAEHDNLYVTTSDQLFLEFMEVCIDELKELLNSIEELKKKVSEI